MVPDEEAGSGARADAFQAGTGRETVGLAVLAALSLAVPCAEAWSGASLARGSLASLALLPWLALGALPRRTSGGSAVLPGALALVPLALGAGLDLARGAPGRALGLAAAAGLATLALWSAAAAGASRTPRARAAYSCAWLALVPGLAALELALEWVPLRAGSEAGAAARAWSVAPLVAARRWGSAGGLEGFGAAEALLAPLAAALVLAVVLALRAHERRADAEARA